MTTFLTYSVYSLRIAGDIPVQSEYLPYILIYFIFSILHTLLSMFWFVLLNLFQTKNYVPKFLIVFASILEKMSCYLCNLRNSFKRTQTIRRTKENNNVHLIRIEKNENESSESPPKVLTPVEKIDKLEPTPTTVKSIETTEEQKEKEKSKKEILESTLNILNYFVFFCLFLFIFVSNLTLWILISK